MELEGSLLISQELFNCPYTEPDQSSPHHPILHFQQPSYFDPPIYILIVLLVSHADFITYVTVSPSTHLILLGLIIPLP
jgi:hypothetical protein